MFATENGNNQQTTVSRPTVLVRSRTSSRKGPKRNETKQNRTKDNPPLQVQVQVQVVLYISFQPWESQNSFDGCQNDTQKSIRGTGVSPIPKPLERISRNDRHLPRPLNNPIRWQHAVWHRPSIVCTWI